MGVLDGVLPAQAMRMRSWAEATLVTVAQISKDRTMGTIRCMRYS